MADLDERAIKRPKMSPADTSFDKDADFVALTHESTQHPHIEVERRRVDPREHRDRPKSKHALPGYEPWILVKTKLGRRFLHNTDTRQSFWRIPGNVKAGVEAFDAAAEKKSNAEWAEQQLVKMRVKPQSNGDDATRRQRRRSESLQREDEAAMLAELAMQADEDAPASAPLGNAASAEARGYLGDASDSEYEYVEVTDSEGEHDDESDRNEEEPVSGANDNPPQDAEPGPVELGEDDIAYQLAMMGESYGLEPEEYGYPEGNDGDIDEDEQAMELSTDEATALFNQMLEEHDVSPFTPWDKIIADTSSTSVVFDARYTLLPSGKARRDAWDAWSRDQAARIQAERATQTKQDPRVAFLAFLSRHANTKLYWPEFKRKFKREPELNDRALHDKDREKLYRDLVVKLKLPEAKRKDELQALLRALPTPSNHQTALPDRMLTSVVLYSVPASTREQMVATYSYAI